MSVCSLVALNLTIFLLILCISSLLFVSCCMSPGPMSGLNEEDLRASLATVEALASACRADMSVLRERQGEEGRTADCLVRRRVDEDDFMEVRYLYRHTCTCTFMMGQDKVRSNATQDNLPYWNSRDS